MAVIIRVALDSSVYLLAFSSVDDNIPVDRSSDGAALAVYFIQNALHQTG
jgi:hypothetical protein